MGKALQPTLIRNLGEGSPCPSRKKLPPDHSMLETA